jgi:hypothetical protein
VGLLGPSFAKNGGEIKSQDKSNGNMVRTSDKHNASILQQTLEDKNKVLIPSRI